MPLETSWRCSGCAEPWRAIQMPRLASPRLGPPCACVCVSLRRRLLLINRQLRSGRTTVTSCPCRTSSAQSTRARTCTIVPDRSHLLSGIADRSHLRSGIADRSHLRSGIADSNPAWHTADPHRELRRYITRLPVLHAAHETRMVNDRSAHPKQCPQRSIDPLRCVGSQSVYCAHECVTPPVCLSAVSLHLTTAHVASARSNARRTSHRYNARCMLRAAAALRCALSRG